MNVTVSDPTVRIHWQMHLHISRNKVQVGDICYSTPPERGKTNEWVFYLSTQIQYSKTTVKSRTVSTGQKGSKSTHDDCPKTRTSPYGDAIINIYGPRGSAFALAPPRTHRSDRRYCGGKWNMTAIRPVAVHGHSKRLTLLVYEEDNSEEVHFSG